MLARHTLTLFALLLHSSTGIFTVATAVAVAAPSFEAAAAADTRPPLPSTEADVPIVVLRPFPPLALVRR